MSSLGRKSPKATDDEWKDAVTHIRHGLYNSTSVQLPSPGGFFKQYEDMDHGNFAEKISPFWDLTLACPPSKDMDNEIPSLHDQLVQGYTSDIFEYRRARGELCLFRLRQAYSLDGIDMVRLDKGIFLMHHPTFSYTVGCRHADPYTNMDILLNAPLSPKICTMFLANCRQYMAQHGAFKTHRPYAGLFDFAPLFQVVFRAIDPTTHQPSPSALIAFEELANEDDNAVDMLGVTLDEATCKMLIQLERQYVP